MSASSVTYGFGSEIDLPVDQAIERVTAALKEEGFGVLTTIDVKQTMKQKLDVDVEPYTILGACNPKLAHRAIEAEPGIGMLLPCNVVVRQQGNRTRVEFADPIAMLGIVQRPDVQAIAEEAAQRLRRVLDSVVAQ